MIAHSKELVEAQYCVAKGFEHDAKVNIYYNIIIIIIMILPYGWWYFLWVATFLILVIDLAVMKISSHKSSTCTS